MHVLNSTSANSKKCNETHVDIEPTPEWNDLKAFDGETICAVLVYLKCEREGWVTVTSDKKDNDVCCVTTGPGMQGIALIKMNREDLCFIMEAYIRRVYRRRWLDVVLL
jgi:hypothetical protein